MPGHVFISYSRADAAYVKRLVEFLDRHQIPVWMDEDLQPGTPAWSRVIEREIEGCAIFLLVMSPRSGESVWVDREIDLAQELNKPIMPLLIEGRRFLRVRDMQAEVVTRETMPGAAFLAQVKRLLGAAPAAGPPDAADAPAASGDFEDIFAKLFGTAADRRRGADLSADLPLDARTAAEGGVVTVDVPGPGEHRAVTVRIPAGVKDGQRIRVGGHGLAGTGGGAPGDLYLTARVAR